jgi:hypothetical protein
LKKLLIVAAYALIVSACSNNAAPTTAPTDAPTATEAPVTAEAPTVAPTVAPTEAPDAVKPFVNVSDVADKSPEEVAAILGEPLFTEDITLALGPDAIEMSITKNYYVEMLEDEVDLETGRVEIMFIDGGARWIRVNFTGDEYNKDDRTANLPLIGLKPTELSENGPVSVSGRSIEGFYFVEVHDVGPGGEGTVKVITKEKYGQ